MIIFFGNTNAHTTTQRTSWKKIRKKLNSFVRKNGKRWSEVDLLLTWIPFQLSPEVPEWPKKRNAARPPPVGPTLSRHSRRSGRGKFIAPPPISLSRFPAWLSGPICQGAAPCPAPEKAGQFELQVMVVSRREIPNRADVGECATFLSLFSVCPTTWRRLFVPRPIWWCRVVFDAFF